MDRTGTTDCGEVSGYVSVSSDAKVLQTTFHISV